MGIIVELDTNTINHIAAGEVVERPASIVKELIENSIDAGSTQIKIDILADKSHVTRIDVVDNGVGMDKDDSLLAFSLHTTSKIRDVSDLASIKTLGFRGEALASIAAISKITLTTKKQDNNCIEATRVVIQGGKLIKQESVGAPAGTRIIVEDIFYNVPARQKFQKSLATELANIYDIVDRISLAHTNISIILQYQSKERYHTYGNGNYEDTISAIFGHQFVKNLISVNENQGLVKVSGYISRPGSDLRTTASQIYISVNQRQVTSKQIQKAIFEGYGTMLPKGMYPAIFLDLVIDPCDIDVNVHPAKKDVRFSKERDVMSCVRESIYSAIHTQDVINNTPIQPDIHSKLDGYGVCIPKPTTDRLINSDFNSNIRNTVSYNRNSNINSVQSRRADIQLRRTDKTHSNNVIYVPEILGQIADTYIICRNNSGELVIIDQHAAHERIMYDQLITQYEKQIPGQELITPIALNLSNKEKAILPDILPILSDAGYTIEPFGNDKWVVRTVPIISDTMGNPKIIHEIIATVLNESSHEDKENVLDRVLKTTACRSVVKGATPLNLSQMQRLVQQLLNTRSPYTCPHGRPTTIVISKQKLESIFLRS
ncbi:MAG TPA: DNA mismatch repair endonuclease MutL [Methanocorpusculum sp.]|nr:DNA mismatch repair endonuclease MutL [Methanocorpusculum sp.]